MRVLLDTNIIIHRESNNVVKNDIGVLFNWFDKLAIKKCIHPSTVTELLRYQDNAVVETISIKIQNYNQLKTIAPDNPQIQAIKNKYDKNVNDLIDSDLLNEVLCGRVDYLITEDRKIHHKAKALRIDEKVFKTNDFLEKVTSENPELKDYKILSVTKEYFGNIELADAFFNSFREDYIGFDHWFTRKSDDIAYTCKAENGTTLAFLYLKIEGENENYSNITPPFQRAKRLKVGTLKVIANGYKLGERFFKIIFDNALNNNVDEVYVTIFNNSPQQNVLVHLLEDWGFSHHGVKASASGEEQVYVKDFKPKVISNRPKSAYPFITKTNRRFYIVPIYPDYHTELLPDSILNNESPDNYVESEPHRNAIKKVYISRSINRSMKTGDIILFYRTGGFYKSVISTIGIVDSVKTNIKDVNEFINLCRKRSIFDDNGLAEHWNYNARNRPFIVNFLYLYSFPSRLNLQKLIQLGIIRNVESAPRGFEEINLQQFETVLRESNSNENFIID